MSTNYEVPHCATSSTTIPKSEKFRFPKRVWSQGFRIRDCVSVTLTTMHRSSSVLTFIAKLLPIILEWIQDYLMMATSGRNMKVRVFWDVALCSHVEGDRRFRVNHRRDDGGSTHLRNGGQLQRDYMVLHPRRLATSYRPPWEPEISHGRNMYFHIFILVQALIVNWR
jgi:hypothetical protein